MVRFWHGQVGRVSALCLPLIRIDDTFYMKQSAFPKSRKMYRSKSQACTITIGAHHVGLREGLDPIGIVDLRIDQIRAFCSSAKSFSEVRGFTNQKCDGV